MRKRVTLFCSLNSLRSSNLLFNTSGGVDLNRNDTHCHCDPVFGSSGPVSSITDLGLGIFYLKGEVLEVHSLTQVQYV